MAALFAYLVSIAIFIGGAYGGMIWLTEPVEHDKVVKSAALPAVARSHRPKMKTAAKDKQPKPNAPVEAKADKPNESQGGTILDDAQKTAEDEARTSPSPSDNHAIEAESTDAANAKQQPDRPDIAAKTETEHVNSPDAAEPHEAIADLSPSPAPNGTSRSGSVREPALPDEHPAINVRKSAATSNASQSAKPQEPEARTERDSASDARAVQRKLDRRSVSASEAKPKFSRTSERTSRSGLVMMTLRTIEFPDGHRERRLLPLHGDNDPDF